MIPLFLLLSGCVGTLEADPYAWRGREIDRDRVTVTKVEFPSRDALMKEARSRGVRFAEGQEGQAFGLVNRRTAECTVYFVNPDVSRSTSWAGHEMVHCFYGNWHK